MNLRFIRLKARNFRSLKNIDIDLDHQTIRQIIGINEDEGGSNGSGKSNILQAFCWCLYGETFPKLQADAVLNDKLKRDCEVSVEFIRNNKHYKVIRYRNHKEYFNKLRIFEDNIDISFHKVNQDFLNSLLGLNFKLFHFCNIFQIERDSLFKMTESKRKMFFEEFIQDIKFFRVFCFDKTKEYIKEKEDKLQELNTDLQKIDTTLFMLDDSLKHKEAKLNTLKKGLKSDYDKLNEQEKKLKNKLETISEEMNKLKKLINNNRISKLMNDLTSLKSEIQEATKNKMELEFKIKRYEDELDILQKNLDSINKDLLRYSKGICPFCFTDLKKHKSKKLQKHINKLEKQRKEFKNKISESINNAAETQKKYEKTLKEISSDEELVEKIEKEIEAINTENINARMKYDDYNYMKVKIESEIDLITDKKELLIAKKKEIKNLKDEIIELEGKINKIKNDEKEINSTIKTIKSDLEHLNILKQLFRVSLPNRLISSFVDMFEYYMNKFINMMEFQTFNIVMKPEKNTEGEITKIPIYVIRYDGIPKNFNELSGGERQRLILAEILAIKQIVEELVDVSYNILWLDEILDISLDTAGSTKIKDLLIKIREKQGYSIELISHSQDLIFENKLIVRKRDGWSMIS